MALPTRSALPSAILVVVLVTAQHAVAFKLDGSTTLGHFPPLLDCAPPPPSGTDDDGAFRANGLRRDDGRAFTRGLCFGFGKRHGSSPGDCLACLSDAARDVLVAAGGGGCGGSRRAGVWRAGCFLSYADTNASTAREDAFRGWFYDDDAGPSAALGSQCAGDRAAAECSRCQNASALVVPALKQLARAHGDAVVVVGYGCYLRVPIEDAQWPWQLRAGALFAVNLNMATIVCAVLDICLWRAEQMMNPA